MSFPLATGQVQCQLVAELTLQDCWEEQVAEGESHTWQSKRVLGDVQVSLESAERDECRIPSIHAYVRWMAHREWVLSCTERDE